MSKQRTIKSDIKLQGKGLHLGIDTDIVIKPAPANHGIVFVRTDIDGGCIIPVGSATLNLQDLSRCSMVHADDIYVSTVEHLMAALAGLGIDNVIVEINHEEVPGLDGSAQDFVDAIDAVGIEELNEERSYCEIKTPIMLEHKGASIMIEPADKLIIDYTLDYDHPLLKQRLSFEINEETFRREIAPSRTFCLKEEKNYLVAQGLGRGATDQNTLVVGDDGPLNNKFRYPDECARHKILDCLGDLFLLGKPIKGRVLAVKSGHALNNRLVQAVCKQEGCAAISY